jgi:hypothetical protein
MSALLFVHVLVAMALEGALIVAAVAALAARNGADERSDLLRALGRRSAAGALIATIGTIGLGEGLAAVEHAHGSWLDASRGLTVFGVLLGGAALTVVSEFARARPRLRTLTAFTGCLLVLIALATAFVMAAKPS